MKYESDYSNIISAKALEKEIHNVLIEMDKAFTNTLGPYGNNTIIEDNYLHHKITKDGFTVFNRLYFYKRMAKVISFIVKKISMVLNETVGDGTTSAVVVASELRSLKKLIKKYKVSPKVIATIIERVAKYLAEIIKQHSIRIDNLPSDFKKAILKNIAAISCNNDYDKGELISNLFMKLRDPASGFVHVELSRNNTSYFDTDKGFEIFRGMLIPEMVTEEDKISAIYENAKYLMIEGQVMSNDTETINTLLDWTHAKSEPLVVIAGGYSEVFKENLKAYFTSYMNQFNKPPMLLCLTVDTESELGKEGFYDVVANVGAQAIRVAPGVNMPKLSIEDIYKKLGTSEKIVMTLTKTRIIRGKQNMAKINERLAELDKRLEFMRSRLHENTESEAYTIMKRKAVLNNDMVTLFIGGSTLDEKETMKYLVIDAVQSCKSAFINGVVTGGNLTVARAINNLLKPNNIDGFTFIDDVCEEVSASVGIEHNRRLMSMVKDVMRYMMNAYIQVYSKILNNKYNNHFKSVSISKKCLKTNTLLNLITDNYEKLIERTENLSLVEDVNRYHELTTPLYTYAESEEGEEPVKTLVARDITFGDSKFIDEFKTKYQPMLKDFSDNYKVINSCETDINILNAATSIITLLITSNQFVRVPRMDNIQKEL